MALGTTPRLVSLATNHTSQTEEANLESSDSNLSSQRVSSVRRSVLPWLDVHHDVVIAEDGRHWVDSSRKSLAEDDHIRSDIVVVVGEEPERIQFSISMSPVKPYFPVRPNPVWTSSVMKRTLCFLQISETPLRYPASGRTTPASP